jgi:hypothetical protein
MKKKILAKGEKIKKSEKIESIYNFLDENNYPYLSFDEVYQEKKFEIDYKGIKLIVSRSNNMDANDEELTPNTFDYYIVVNDREIRNSAKDIPKILDYLKSKYADGGSILLAPNGKPSNLTPEQYRLVRTPAFKKWFGDWEKSPETASKVVDENGEPLVVFQGTHRDFSVFDKSYIGSNSPLKDDKGFFFTSSEKEAKEYGKVMNFFLSIKNPLIDDTNDKYNTSAIYYWDMRRKTYIEQSKENDGVLVLSSASNMYVAFEPNQIKLADGTNTTFDSNNADIRFSKGGTTKINLIKTYLHHEEYSDTEYLAFGYKHNRVFAIGKNEFTQSFMKETIKEYYNNVSIIKFGKLFRKHIYPYFSAEFNKERIRPNFSWKELSSYIIGDGDYSIQHEQFLSFCKEANINLPKLADTTFDSNNPDIRYDKGGEVFNNLSDKSKEIIDANYEGRGSFGFYDFDYNKESERENYFEWLKDFKENQFKKNLSKVIKQVESDIKLKKEKEKYKIKLKYFEELIIPSLGNEVLIPELSIYEKQILLDPNATIESIQKGFIDAKNIIDEDGSINQSKITPSNFIVDDEINLHAFEKFVEKNPQYKNVFNDWKKMLDEYMYLSIQKTYAFRYPSVDDLEYLHYELVDLKDKKSKDKFNTGGEVYKIKYADGGYLSETLTIDEVENLLGRKLHWWNDDTIILGNVKYKKIYLQPLYEKVI